MKITRTFMSGDVGAADRVSGMRHVLGAITQQKQCDFGAMFEQRLPWKLYFDYERTRSRLLSRVAQLKSTDVADEKRWTKDEAQAMM